MYIAEGGLDTLKEGLDNYMYLYCENNIFVVILYKHTVFCAKGLK